MKTFWTILISFVVTAVIVSGGTYYYFHQKADKDKKNLQAQIDDLKSSLTAADQSLAAQNTNAAVSDSAVSTITVDPTSGWSMYTDKTLGFTFKYPSIFVNSTTSQKAGQDNFNVTVTKISALGQDPMGHSQADAVARQTALAAGQLPTRGTEIGQPFQASEKVISINGKYSALDDMILEELTCDDVQVARETVFYVNGYEVEIYSSIGGDARAVVPAKYLKLGTECLGAGTTQQVWGDQSGFYDAISAKKLTGNIQSWYNDYDLLIKSIKF